MKKYKVLIPFFKLSDKKNYVPGDEVELTDEHVDHYVSNGYVEGDKKENKNGAPKKLEKK